MVDVNSVKLQDVIEFESIIYHCKVSLYAHENYMISFIWR